MQPCFVVYKNAGLLFQSSLWLCVRFKDGLSFIDQSFSVHLISWEKSSVPEFFVVVCSFQRWSGNDKQHMTEGDFH